MVLPNSTTNNKDFKKFFKIRRSNYFRQQWIQWFWEVWSKINIKIYIIIEQFVLKNSYGSILKINLNLNCRTYFKHIGMHNQFLWSIYISSLTTICQFKNIIIFRCNMIGLTYMLQRHIALYNYIKPLDNLQLIIFVIKLVYKKYRTRRCTIMPI
jgi:hypothetical protein